MSPALALARLSGPAMSLAAPESASTGRARLSALYALSFGALGAIYPYLALELRSAGASALVLVLALSAAPVSRLVGGPLWGALADRFRVEGRLLVLGAALALLGAILLAISPTLALPGALLLALGRAPLDTILEGLTLQAVGPDPVAYGRIRLWGSLGFLLAALLGGWLHDRAGPGPMALGAALSLVLLALALRTPPPRAFAPAAVGPALRALWRSPGVPWFLLAAALHFLSHAGATSFLGVHLASLGAPQRLTGLTVAVGVTVEIIVMARSKVIFARWSPDTVLLVSLLLGLPRWLGNALLPSPLAVVLLQALHGVTFGAFWVAAVAWIAARARPEIRTSAQALLGAAVAGVGALGGSVLGGWLIDVSTTDRMFLAMAGASALGVLALLRARACVHAAEAAGR